MAQFEFSKMLDFFMVHNFSVNFLGLYINWANTSLFIILGKFLTLNLPKKKPTFIKVAAILSDTILVSNYYGCKGKAISLVPHCLIDIYKTVKSSLLEKL